MLPPTTAAPARVRDDPRFKIFEFDRNIGHLGAAIKLLDHVSGEFVCFIDSDDFLFPDYLASHVQTHLALPAPVGLTSSSYVEIDRHGRLLNAAPAHLSDVAEKGERGFRPVRMVPRLTVVSNREFDRLSKASSYLPWNARGWLWGPGTSNMYRRSLMELARPALPNDVWLGGVDAYFNSFVHVLTGTGIIDQQLSAYRIHGANDYSLRPMVTIIRSGSEESDARAIEVRQLLCRTLLERCRQVDFVLNGDRFWTALDVIPCCFGRELAAFHARLADAFAANFPALCAVFGEKRVIMELRQRLTHADFRGLMAKAHGGRIPIATRRRMTSVEVSRQGRRLRGVLASVARSPGRA